MKLLDQAVAPKRPTTVIKIHKSKLSRGTSLVSEVIQIAKAKPLRAVLHLSLKNAIKERFAQLADENVLNIALCRHRAQTLARALVA